MVYPIKFSGLLEEGSLEVLFIDRTRLNTQLHKHLTGVTNGQPIDHFSPPLSHNHFQKSLPQVVSNVAVTYDMISEQIQAQIVDIVDTVLLNVNSVLRQHLDETRAETIDHSPYT